MAEHEKTKDALPTRPRGPHPQAHLDERILRAVGLGHRLARLLTAVDPNPDDAFLAVPIRTPDGAFLWDVTVSEAGVERLTELLEAVEWRLWDTRKQGRHLHAVQDVS
jgi:hypothetical protein